MNEVKTKLINKYLKEIKKEVSKGNYILVPRAKNMNTLKELGINLEIVEDIIYDLNIDNYICGPEEDRDTNIGMIWKFKYDYDNTIVLYIKTNISSDSKMKIISFHIDE